MGIADDKICIKRGPRGHPSQWASHLAADLNCLLKKTDSWGPSENNYIHIFGDRPWESPCTPVTRTLGPKSRCLHQTLESPPKTDPASARTWGEAADITHPKLLIPQPHLRFFQVLDWDRPGFKPCCTLYLFLWLCAKWLRTLCLGFLLCEMGTVLWDHTTVLDTVLGIMSCQLKI